MESIKAGERDLQEGRIIGFKELLKEGARLKSIADIRLFRKPRVSLTKQVRRLIFVILLLILSGYLLSVFFQPDISPQRKAIIKSLGTELVEYGPNENVTASIQVKSLISSNLNNLSINLKLEDALGYEIESRARQISLTPFSTEKVSFDFKVKGSYIAGYVLKAVLYSGEGSVLDEKSWVFNVSPDWTRTARLTLLADLGGDNATFLVSLLKRITFLFFNFGTGNLIGAIICQTQVSMRACHARLEDHTTCH